MAEPLEEFPAHSNIKRCTYPWEEWLDGRPWKLTLGEDFHTAVHTMQTTALGYAWRHGLTIRTTILDDRTLVIQKIV